MKTLGLIPARAGSKRIPDKNLQLVNGRPLVERAIICAKAALTLDLIVVSSDDERVKVIADAHDVQFLMRPDELAQDDSPMQGVVDHLLDNYDFDVVCILEPPATFRRPQDIDGAIGALGLGTPPMPDSVRTVTRIAAPRHSLIRNVDGFLDPVNTDEYYRVPRGHYPLYRDNGIANVVRVGAPMFGRVRPYIIEEDDRGLDIDTPDQLALARRMAVTLDRE